MVATIEVSGLDVTVKNLERISAGLGGAGLVKPMRDATMVVTKDAKELAPVDTGNLRSSIAPEVHPFGNTIEGIVGSPVKYAPYMELGTRPHFVPLSALQVWASRHNISAFLVQRAIATKGTKARRYLQTAFENNIPKINQIFEDYVNRLTNG